MSCSTSCGRRCVWVLAAARRFADLVALRSRAARPRARRGRPAPPRAAAAPPRAAAAAEGRVQHEGAGEGGEQARRRGADGRGGRQGARGGPPHRVREDRLGQLLLVLPLAGVRDQVHVHRAPARGCRERPGGGGGARGAHPGAHGGSHQHGAWGGGGGRAGGRAGCGGGARPPPAETVRSVSPPPSPRRARPLDAAPAHCMQAERATKLAELEALHAETARVAAELRAYADSDPEAYTALKAKIVGAKKAADRWTDNVFTVRAARERRGMACGGSRGDAPPTPRLLGLHPPPPPPPHPLPLSPPAPSPHLRFAAQGPPGQQVRQGAA